MKNAIIYIHGKGGNATESEHYKKLFNNDVIIGFDYKSKYPWEANVEFPQYFDKISAMYDKISIIANSIGAYFAMNSLSDKPIANAYFISPIVNMEQLISDMMNLTNITEEELQEKGEIVTQFGETLSWEYFCYVKGHKLNWKIPTKILYGENDNLTSYKTISDFAEQFFMPLTVMKNGEHWFHTTEQMDFLDNWIK